MKVTFPLIHTEDQVLRLQDIIVILFGKSENKHNCISVLSSAHTVRTMELAPICFTKRHLLRPSQVTSSYLIGDLYWFFFFFLIYLFLAVLGLCFRVRAFSSCGKWGPLFIAVRGPLTIAASLTAEHRLQMRRLSNCGSQA